MFNLSGEVFSTHNGNLLLVFCHTGAGGILPRAHKAAMFFRESGPWTSCANADFSFQCFCPHRDHGTKPLGDGDPLVQPSGLHGDGWARLLPRRRAGGVPRGAGPHVPRAPRARAPGALPRPGGRARLHGEVVHRDGQYHRSRGRSLLPQHVHPVQRGHPGEEIKALGPVRFVDQKEPEPENSLHLLVGNMQEPIRRQVFLVLAPSTNRTRPLLLSLEDQFTSSPQQIPDRGRVKESNPHQATQVVPRSTGPSLTGGPGDQGTKDPGGDQEACPCVICGCAQNQSLEWVCLSTTHTCI